MLDCVLFVVYVREKNIYAKYNLMDIATKVAYTNTLNLETNFYTKFHKNN